MKHYDLEPDARMSPVVGLLHSMVLYNVQRLKRLTADLTQEEIDYKGEKHELNSAAQLLRHLAVVDLHWVYRLQSREVPEELTKRFGPMYDADGTLPLIQGISLQTLFEEYDEIQGQVTAVCLGLSDDDLTRIVPFENGNTATVQWGIWHIADHSRHHYANIAYLKKRVRERV